jgi:hypothetical protein
VAAKIFFLMVIIPQCSCKRREAQPVASTYAANEISPQVAISDSKSRSVPLFHRLLIVITVVDETEMSVTSFYAGARCPEFALI